MLIDPMTFVMLSKQHLGRGFVNPTRRWEFPWVVAQLSGGKPDSEIRFGPVDCGMKIMDAGAGKTPLPIYLADRGATVYTVDDGGEREDTWGFMDYSKIHPLITSHQRDFTDLSWMNRGLLDAIVSVSTIEHLKADRRRAMWEAFWHSLKPGGRLVITVDLMGEDGMDLLNLGSPGEEIDDSSTSHGDVSDLIREAGRGFRLDRYELCPLDLHIARDVVIRVAGLAFTRRMCWI